MSKLHGDVIIPHCLMNANETVITRTQNSTKRGYFSGLIEYMWADEIFYIKQVLFKGSVPVAPMSVPDDQDDPAEQCLMEFIDYVSTNITRLEKQLEDKTLQLSKYTARQTPYQSSSGYSQYGRMSHSKETPRYDDYDQTTGKHGKKMCTQQPRPFSDYSNLVVTTVISRISDLKKQLKEKGDELRKCKQRLTGEAERNTQSDQMEVEDISHPNRPSKVIDEYMRFIDGGRMTFVNSLNVQYMHDETKYTIACNIFQIIYTQSKEAIKGFEKEVSKLLLMPLQLAYINARSVEEAKKSKEKNKDPPLSSEARVVHEDMSLFLKRTAHTTNLQPIIEKSNEVIVEYIKTSYPQLHPERFRNDMDRYVARCAALCWKMVVQTPRFLIDVTSEGNKPFDRTRHQTPTEAPHPRPNARIKAYLWPALYRVKSEGKKVSVPPIVSVK